MVDGQVQRLFHSAFWSMNKNSITHTCQAANRITVQYHLFLICPEICATTPLLLDSFPHLIPLKSVFFVSFFYRPVVFYCPVILYNLSALDKSRGRGRGATVNKIKQRSLRSVIWIQTATRTDGYSVILPCSCRTSYSGYVVSYGNGRITNDELERIWQEATITYSELISQICYRIRIKTTKCHSQQPVLVQHSKWILCDRQWDELPLRQRHWSSCHKLAEWWRLVTHRESVTC